MVLLEPVLVVADVRDDLVEPLGEVLELVPSSKRSRGDVGLDSAECVTVFIVGSLHCT